ncbi:MAG: zinc-ribbon domain-containing protein [archaeon]|nr:zinc-ribbon domain-containing protein [archaeon]MCQ2972220.1 zinc-ribbon domain-containing protein [archaeon]
MYCPNCGKENKDGVSFCKFCGASLNSSPKQNNSEQVVTQQNTSDEDMRKNYIIIGLVALIVVVILIAGLAAAGVFNNNNNGNNVNHANVASNNNNTVTANANSPLKILGCSFTTGSANADKTYAHINVGKQHAGQTVKITAIWSRDGNNLNNGNLLTRTVDSNGYVDFNSANAFKYYPDKAVVKLYNNDGSLADQLTVNLSPTSGTQTF